MTEKIEFYFDFSSPYGYVAAHRIEELGQKHGCEVIWKPFLLGATFQLTGNRPLKDQQLKWDYSSHDLLRTVRRYNVAWQLPEIFPIPTQAAGRAFYWICDQDVAKAKDFALKTYQAYFAEGIDIRAKESVAEIASGFGLDKDECLSAIDNEAIKQRLKDVTAEAIERNVCGSPFFFVGDEPFWGNDRIDMMEEWLTEGGW